MKTRFVSVSQSCMCDKLKKGLRLRVRQAGYMSLLRCFSSPPPPPPPSWQLKLRNVATTQQEKLLGEKEASLERQVQENQGLSRSLAQKDEEVTH